MFTVYVLYNILAKKSYTGQTDNINRRLLEHNNHSLGGFTSRYRGEWVLIYTESVTTRSEALMREKQLKSGNRRAYIKQYIPG
jgi:putative endonuclease